MVITEQGRLKVLLLGIDANQQSQPKLGAPVRLTDGISNGWLAHNV